jgi:hypothetical protein
MTRNCREEKMTILFYNQSFRMMHTFVLKIAKALGCQTETSSSKKRARNKCEKTTRPLEIERNENSWANR